MRKIVSNILITSFILCFAIQESFAFGKPGCTRWDLLCKATGRGAVVTPSAETTKDESSNDIVKKMKISNGGNNNEFNIFTGQFDFSDHKQKAGLIGVEHQNEDLFRNSFLGKLSPITGGFLTENNAYYLYTGIQAEYNLGSFSITPSFAPGYYSYGNGKDLGSPLEFKSEVQVSFDVSESTHLGLSYNHISNASLGDKNPGANSYMFNFLKQF